MQLDSAQQVVANHQYGPLLVLAGPGSGKTASITARSARLVNGGVDPARLLSVTFSKKATNEMRERLSAQTSLAAAEQASIHTFHALGDKIMKTSPEACGRQYGYTILDEPDQRGIFVRVLKERMKMEKPGKYDYRKWLSAYSRMGQDGVSALDTRHAQSFSDAMYSYAGIERQDQMRWLWFAFQQFEAAKKEQNVVDFNDLLLLPLMGMKKDEGLARQLAQHYQLITVDEAQDTCRVQYDLICELASFHGNLIMVGDDDQSLYGWRGANSRNLKQFIEEFSPKIHKLERNYRSTTHLVKAAASHISHNQYRLEKTPFSTRNENDKPSLFSTSSDRQMAQNLVGMLKARHADGVAWEDQAILYRKNRVGEALEPALIDAGIPYEVQGGVKLTERKEVKLALSLARLVNNPKDQMAFNLLARGIPGLGERGVENHISECRERHQGELLHETISIRRKEQVRASIVDLIEICDDLKEIGPNHLIGCMVDRWGLSAYFPDDKPEQIEVREQRLRMFDQWIEAALEQAGPDENPWLVMQRSLLEDPETDLSEGGKVVLSTVHRAKGLEWPIVHVAGYSDGLMPMRNKEGGVDDPEEERNISYVAMTRAANELYLHHADRFFLGYEALDLEPSPYLDEFEWISMDRAPQPVPESAELGICEDLGLPGWAT